MRERSDGGGGAGVERGFREVDHERVADGDDEVGADAGWAMRLGERGAGAATFITSDESRAEVQRMRHAADALVTGIGTVLADDPMMTDRSGIEEAAAAAAGDFGFGAEDASEVENGGVGARRFAGDDAVGCGCRRRRGSCGRGRGSCAGEPSADGRIDLRRVTRVGKARDFECDAGGWEQVEWGGAGGGDRGQGDFILCAEDFWE